MSEGGGSTGRRKNRGGGGGGLLASCEAARLVPAAGQRLLVSHGATVKGLGGGAEGGGEVGYLILQLLPPLLHAPVLRQQLCMLRVLGNPSL